MLDLARQKRVAAEALWRSGSAAEGLRMGTEAFRATQDAVGLFTAPPGPQPPDDLPPSPLILSRRDEVTVAEAAQDLSALASPPIFDRDVGDEHAEAMARLLRASEALDRAATQLCWNPRRRALSRVLRTALAVLGVGSLCAGAVLLITPKKPEAAASSFWGNLLEFGPNNVLDGSDQTEWLLPDGVAGWVEVRFARPRTVSVVRLLNAHNRNLNDRSTRAYRVELVSRGRVVASSVGEYPELSPKPKWTAVSTVGKNVESVRVHVLSWHAKGGGFAEIEIL
jgi:hypothetical protein